MTTNPWKLKEEGLRYIWRAFAEANERATIELAVDGNPLEVNLDHQMLATLRLYGAQRVFGNEVYHIATHDISGSGQREGTEIADIAIVFWIIEKGRIAHAKVGLLQSKRLYADGITRYDLEAWRDSSNYADKDGPHDLCTGLQRSLHERMRFLGSDCRFRRESLYEAIDLHSKQVTKIQEYQDEMEKHGGKVPVYYLLYNPPELPWVVSVPATMQVSHFPNRLGARVVSADEILALRASHPGLRTPSHEQVEACSRLASTVEPGASGSLRLEDFVVSGLMRCPLGCITDHNNPEAIIDDICRRRTRKVRSTVVISVTR